jgi:hypothetical protein
MKITYYIKSSKEPGDRNSITIKKGFFTTNYAYAVWGEYDPGDTVITEIHEWENKKLYQWITDQGYTYEISPDII